MRKSYWQIAIGFLVILTTSCSSFGVSQNSVEELFLHTTTSPTKEPGETDLFSTLEAEEIAEEGDGAILLFSIGMHIEPLGTTAQGYPSGRGDYHQEAFFMRHVQDILTVADIVESHGGVMTIQAQSPFTSAALEFDNSILEELASRGHEIALHFHEDAHLGKDSESLTVEDWCTAMLEEIELIKQASGVDAVRYWSGGNLYVNLFQAAACAGLDINSDWKNPNTQQQEASLAGVNPWRPAGGTDGFDFTNFASHHPSGEIIFLPQGVSIRGMQRGKNPQQDLSEEELFFKRMEVALMASLQAAEAGKVNVFHITIHPGELRGDPADPFALLEKFLTQVVDPLVNSGKLQWATFSQMADAYIAWEAANPGVAPK